MDTKIIRNQTTSSLMLQILAEGDLDGQRVIRQLSQTLGPYDQIKVCDGSPHYIEIPLLEPTLDLSEEVGSLLAMNSALRESVIQLQDDLTFLIDESDGLKVELDFYKTKHLQDLTD